MKWLYPILCPKKAHAYIENYLKNRWIGTSFLLVAIVSRHIYLAQFSPENSWALNLQRSTTSVVLTVLLTCGIIKELMLQSGISLHETTDWLSYFLMVDSVCLFPVRILFGVGHRGLLAIVPSAVMTVLFSRFLCQCYWMKPVFTISVGLIFWGITSLFVWGMG